MKSGHLGPKWVSNALDAVYVLTTRESKVKATSPQVVLALMLKTGQLGNRKGLNMNHQNSCLMSKVVEVSAHFPRRLG